MYIWGEDLDGRHIVCGLQSHRFTLASGKRMRSLMSANLNSVHSSWPEPSASNSVKTCADSTPLLVRMHPDSAAGRGHSAFEHYYYYLHQVGELEAALYEETLDLHRHLDHLPLVPCRTECLADDGLSSGVIGDRGIAWGWRACWLVSVSARA